jgi:hypothetical protein
MAYAAETILPGCPQGYLRSYAGRVAGRDAEPGDGGFKGIWQVRFRPQAGGIGIETHSDAAFAFPACPGDDLFHLVQVYLIGFLVLILFVHVFNHMFKNEKVGSVASMDFDAVLIIPFNDSSNFLPVRELDDHRGFRGHLLDIIIIFGVRYLRRNSFPGDRSVAGHLILDL